MAVSIRPLQADELSTADYVFRLAFGTFIGLPQPTDFAGDAHYIQPRWQADPTVVFAAEVEGKLVGSIIAVNWGSVGFFGPLSVHPDYWGRGIAQRLIEPVIDQFKQWGMPQTGLFTFPNSPQHHGLYQKFGFYPRFLTFVMGKSIQALATNLPGTRFSDGAAELQSQVLEQCRALTDAIYPGLDISFEIRSVLAQQLGDTLLLWDDRGLAGFAVCHCGAQSEAGSGVCFVKFGAVRPGAQSGERFERLLDLCEAFTALQHLDRLVAGINTSQADAYSRLVARRYRTEITGVAMHCPNEPGYHRPDAFVLSDWR